VEVKIGIQSVPRELVVETSTSYEDIQAALAAAVAAEGGIFTLAHAKGGHVLVPADKIAYVEYGIGEARRVGFG
jgi:hypothetical protein